MFTILVVEDEEPVRELVAELLTTDGYHVQVAIHGGQALELAEQALPDLVLTDLMMPMVDGAELIRRLRAREETKGIPIILMTSAGRKAADGANADAYLAKPFNLDELEELVRKLLPAG